MACPACETFAVDIEIHGPAQLRRIAAKLQAAVSEQRLQSVPQIETLTSIEQPEFIELDLSETLPDVMSYDLQCRICGQVFRLQCESYHGSGGSWQAISGLGHRGFAKT
jgi:hypothetical protein